jgi:hypothetical protein
MRATIQLRSFPGFVPEPPFQHSRPADPSGRLTTPMSLGHASRVPEVKCRWERLSLRESAEYRNLPGAVKTVKPEIQTPNCVRIALAI